MDTRATTQFCDEVPRVLVVDDDPTVLALHSAMLRRMGYDPVTARDGIEAMTALREAWPVALAVIDWHMSPLNGYAFATALRADETYSRVPLIMVTAEERSERIAEAFAAGVDEVLPKPMTLAVMRRAVAAHRGGRQSSPAPPVSSRIASEHGPTTSAAHIAALHDYRLGPWLGGGGTAQIFQLVDERRPPAALKVSTHAVAADSDAARRFQREIGILQNLRHPHVLRVEHGGLHDERWYLVMERAASDLVAEIETNHGRLEPPVARQLIGQLAGAVHAIHQSGIVHRDLKPGNVLVRADGSPVIADFGLAAFQRDRLRLTQEGRVVGTPAYMAPEAVMGRAGADPAVDIYALGATWYHCLTGAPPFEGATPWETFQRIVHEPLPDLASTLPDLPAADRELLSACLAKDPRERPGDAELLQRALTAR